MRIPWLKPEYIEEKGYDGAYRALLGALRKEYLGLFPLQGSATTGTVDSKEGETALRNALADLFVKAGMKEVSYTAFTEFKQDMRETCFAMPSGFFRVNFASTGPADIRMFRVDWCCALGRDLTKDRFQELLDAIEKLKAIHNTSKEKSDRSNLYMLESQTWGLQFKAFHFTSALPLVQSNYDANTLKQMDRVVDALGGGGPVNGRLLLLSGPTGTGKSHLIRHMLHALPNMAFVYMPAAHMSRLEDPAVFALLNELRASNPTGTAFIIEDGDNALMTRGADNMHNISPLLNVTCGLPAESLNTYVVLTTNKKTADMDEALRRDGRLLDHIQVNHLSGVHAVARFREIVAEKTPAGRPYDVDFQCDMAKAESALSKGAALSQVYRFARSFIPQLPDLESARGALLAPKPVIA